MSILNENTDFFLPTLFFQFSTKSFTLCDCLWIFNRLATMKWCNFWKKKRIYKLSSHSAPTNIPISSCKAVFWDGNIGEGGKYNLHGCFQTFIEALLLDGVASVVYSQGGFPGLLVGGLVWVFLMCPEMVMQAMPLLLPRSAPCKSPASVSSAWAQFSTLNPPCASFGLESLL